jgi:NTP pyrophosphatase (non-canonical NTP hydrolase)
VICVNSGGLKKEENMSDEHLIGSELRDLDADEKSVTGFAVKMILKLEKNRHKKHWSTVDAEYLFNRLLQEVEELRDALAGTDGDIVSECCDVANFAMMIADNLNNSNAGAVPRRGSDVGTSPLLGISSGAE